MPTPAFERLPVSRQAEILNHGIQAFATTPYSQVGTEAIAKACGISKGLLFHYFGSKSAYYLHCLDTAIHRLMVKPSEHRGGFYDVLFASMSDKLSLYLTHPHEIRFANTAAWETAPELLQAKGSLFQRYQQITTERSSQVISAAVASLTLKAGANALVTDALTLYIGALSNRFLLAYREKPDAFFAQAETLQAEIRVYIDLMLFGILKEETL